MEERGREEGGGERRGRRGGGEEGERREGGGGLGWEGGRGRRKEGRERRGEGERGGERWWGGGGADVELDMCVCPCIPAACNELGGKSPGSQTPGDPATPSPPWWWVNPGLVPVHRALPAP